MKKEKCEICTEMKLPKEFKETCGNNNHEICEDCYNKWTQLKNTCPTCRSIIKNAIAVEEYTRE